VQLKAASGCGAMSELVEARDIDGQLYISAHNLTQAIERARKSGAEHERVRLLSMMTPAERRGLRVIEVCVDAGVSPKDVMGGQPPREGMPGQAAALL
jgi:hypothetical protein